MLSSWVVTIGRKRGRRGSGGVFELEILINSIN